LNEQLKITVKTGLLFCLTITTTAAAAAFLLLPLLLSLLLLFLPVEKAR
jgi:hypothetical protein